MNSFQVVQGRGADRSVKKTDSEIEQFLTALYGGPTTPEDTIAVIAYPVRGRKGLTQIGFNNTAAMAARVTALAVRDDVSAIYHSVGVFNGKPGLHPNRKAINCAGVAALVVDLDVGEGKPYASKREALFAAHSSLRSVLGIDLRTDATVIDSGAGIHVYVHLAKLLPPAEWLPIATKFKSALLAAGLALDEVVTADPARIMRTPGSMHKKDPLKVRPCRVLEMPR